MERVQDVDNKIDIIIRQTDYTKEKALEKLHQFDFDEIRVIKDYFGIKDKKTPQIKSVNQAIYAQLRSHLDTAMRDYNVRVEKGEAKKVI
jgi:hypothetical protein